MDDVLIFECHDWLTDLRDVLIKHLSLKDGEELWEVVHDTLPVALSNRVSRAFRMRSVDEDLPLVETDVERANHCVLSHS